MSLAMHRPAFVILVVLSTIALAVLAAILFIFLWITIARAPSTTSKSSLGRSAAVVVLGDVGRSPRMCFHAQSLAEDGWRVAVVGYKGTPPPPPLRRSSVRLHYVVQPLARFLDALPKTGGLFALLTAPLKVLGQSVALFWILSTQVRPPPELIIAQTPPALPTLVVVRLVGLLLGSRVVIDWHNFGYSILALRFKPTSLIVRLAAFLERLTGRKAFAHLCVTNALRQHLIDRWHVKGLVRVLYDRPPSHYKRASVPESHELFASLIPSLEPSIRGWCDTSGKNGPFTRVEDGRLATLRADRPALVVSSTSWTADEDFGMLLRAASAYEARARILNDATDDSTRSSPRMSESPLVGSSEFHKSNHSLGSTSLDTKRSRSRRVSFTNDALPKASRLPKMLLIVTGKGELKEDYLRQIERLEREEEWRWVRIRTAWLAIEDYPRLLGSADVGVSLHSSSSGLDLPMKVVDMLGCGLPVCALGFPCIGELVQHGNNGLVFYSDKELASQLESLLANHPEQSWLAAKTSALPSLFPEDIPHSPTVSAASSPVLGFNPETPKSSSSPPPASAYEYTINGRPSSPLPMFTLLQSPVSAAFDLSVTQPHYQAQQASSGGIAKLRNWSGNWKRVVRPLILAADLEEEGEVRRHQRKSPISKGKLGTSHGELTPKRRSSDGEASLMGRRASGEHHPNTDAVRRRRLLYEEEGEEDAGQTELRHRAKSALQAPADIRSIPGIQISAPAID